MSVLYRVFVSFINLINDLEFLILENKLLDVQSEENFLSFKNGTTWTEGCTVIDRFHRITDGEYVETHRSQGILGDKI